VPRRRGIGLSISLWGAHGRVQCHQRSPFSLPRPASGSHTLSVVYLIPMSALGVLLVFAGSQLALTILDLKERKDLFVPLMMVGITLASNLAVGFIVGIALAYALKSEKFTI